MKMTSASHLDPLPQGERKWLVVIPSPRLRGEGSGEGSAIGIHENDI